MGKTKSVLALFAHPDDTEFMCAGTLALLHQRDWEIHIATMTPGDVGSAELSREEISQIRRAEAVDSAGVLNGSYHCLECRDVFIMYDCPTLLKTIELFRKVRPALVIAPSSTDYIVDHEVTSKIAKTACMAAGIPNIEIPDVQSFQPMPFLYYTDPVEGNDDFGNNIEPDVLVDISSVIDTKEKMLCCHKSQRNWLRAHHGVDQYVIMMKDLSAKRGKQAHCRFAEGFRQHLGFSYPQENLLKLELDGLVKDQKNNS